jgi:transposase
MEAWKQLEPVGRKHRGLVSLMRRRPDRLEAEQQLRLRAYFTEHPMVGAVYDQLQRLMQLLRYKHQKAKQCRWHIRHFLRIVDELRAAPMTVLQTLATTLSSWREPIARMWRFTKSNAITESLHNKMEGHQPSRVRLPELSELPVAGASPLRIDLTRSVVHFKNAACPRIW